jgi:hypothetical protein
MVARSTLFLHQRRVLQQQDRRPERDSEDDPSEKTTQHLVFCTWCIEYPQGHWVAERTSRRHRHRTLYPDASTHLYQHARPTGVDELFLDDSTFDSNGDSDRDNNNDFGLLDSIDNQDEDDDGGRPVFVTLARLSLISL